MKMRRLAALAACAFCSILANCSSGAVGSLPRHVSPDGIPGNSALQLAVGVATVGLKSGNCAISAGASATPPFYGLNLVSTYRSADGLSAVLYDTPSVTGPAGFAGDLGTATIYNTFGGLSTTLNQQPYEGQQPLQVSQTGSLYALGAFGYGFAGEQLVSAAPIYEVSALPAHDYRSATCNTPFGLSGPRYVGGPPAWPAVNNGLFTTLPNGANPADLSGFVGYNMGFFDYLSIPATVPPLGTYQLEVDVPVGAGSGPNGALTGASAGDVRVRASAQLTSQTALPLFATPSAVRDPARPGGLIITATVPAGVTQAFAEVRVGINRAGRSIFEYYSVALPTSTPGLPVNVVLPDALGLPLDGQTTPTPSVPSDSAYSVYAVGFDYDAFGPSYPNNHDQRPPIVGANGQADVTTSDIFNSQ